jgi:hypothetical protein
MLAVMETDIPDRVIDVEGFFKSRAIVVGQQHLTLDRLENEFVRPMGDPRIHSALNCAAMSCPTLSRLAFRAATLDAQFDAQCRAWVNDPSKNRVDSSGIVLSEIFKWFASDFEVEPYEDRIGFLSHYATPGSEMAKTLAKRPRPSIESERDEIHFIPYDWSLNRSSSDPSH